MHSSGSSIDDNGMYERTTELHFRPIFEYTVDGNTYIKKSASGSSSCPYYIGQTIEIHYDPSNPNTYYVKSGLNIVLGIIFSIIGLAVMILS